MDKKYPVIPLCHSGMTPTDLPTPLNLLQAAKMTDVSGLNLVLPVLANALGATSPKIDFSNFISKVNEFEARYTFWHECNKLFKKISAIHQDIIPNLRTQKIINLQLADSQIKTFECSIDFLRRNDLLDFKRSGGVSVTNDGTFYYCSLHAMPNLRSVLSSPEFKI